MVVARVEIIGDNLDELLRSIDVLMIKTSTCMVGKVIAYTFISVW